MGWRPKYERKLTIYISARQIERDIKIHKHNYVEDIIKETAQVILNQLKDYLMWTNDELNTDGITIEELFESKDEGDVENAEKLQYLIDNMKKIVEKLEINQTFDIGTLNDPAYSIEISKDINEKIKVSAYSNLDNNYFWDEVIEWIEWGEKHVKK